MLPPKVDTANHEAPVVARSGKVVGVGLEDVAMGHAGLGDLDGILKLAAANDEEHGGELSGHLTRDAVAATIGRLPNIVAHKDGELVGFLLAWEKLTYGSPRVRAMLQAYPGSRDAYVYGPVCVAASMRGRGLAGAMFGELRRLVPGREGILYIKANNESSLRAHRKMGMRQVASFTHQGFELVVLAYPG